MVTVRDAYGNTASSKNAWIYRHRQSQRRQSERHHDGANRDRFVGVANSPRVCS